MLGFDFTTIATRQNGARPNVLLDFSTVNLPVGVGLTRNSVASYFDASGNLMSAALDTARFDYSPVNFGLRGLLLEGAATNYLQDSADFSTYSADGTALLVSNDTTLLGLPAALLDYGATSGGANRISVAAIIPAGAPQTTMSAIVKSDTATKIGLRAYCPGTTVVDAIADFDLTNGTVLSSSAGATATGYQDLGGGLYKLWVAFTPGSDCVTVNARFGAPVSNTSVGTTAHIVAAQLEFGAAPTSYVATAGTLETRAADVTSLNNWSGQYDVSVTYDDLSVDTYLNVAVSPGYFPALSRPRVRQISLTPV